MTLTTGGNVLIGSTTARTAGSGSGINLQLEGAPSPSNFGLIRNSNNAFPARIMIAKTRGTVVGSNTIVQNGDQLGLIEFDGADGTGLILGASIEAYVDGTPGTNDMPGRLVFNTTGDGAASATERMRIDSSGNVMVATTNALANITSSSGNGISLYATSGNTQILCSNTSDHCAQFNLQGTDGLIINFRKSGASLGGISVASTGMTYTATNGVTFTATQTASADANTLDDYEEGTWTPTIGRDGAVNPTYTEQVGYYVKIGRVVYLWGYVVWSAIGTTSAGGNRIQGLPFNAGSSQQNGWANFGGATGLATNPVLAGMIYNTDMYLRKSANILASTNADEAYQASGVFAFNGMYNIF
jgi:hypothetical protein